MSYSIRPFEPGDSQAVKHVQRQVMCLGRPLPFPVQDFDLLIDYALDYYLREEPQNALVATDGQGRIVGYLIGTLEVARHARWQRLAALRLAARWAARWAGYDAFTRWFYRLRLLDAREVIRRPSPVVGGHLHWNLLPEARGLLAVEFMRTFDAKAVAAGIDSYAGEISVTADRLDGRMFRRVRMAVFDRVPNHTLSALAGEPIYRLVTVTRAGSLLPSARPDGV